MCRPLGFIYFASVLVFIDNTVGYENLRAIFYILRPKQKICMVLITLKNEIGSVGCY